MYFEKIATKDAAGFSNGLREYTHVDQNPYIGINYYRLKMFDQDGTFQYSYIVSVPIGEGAWSERIYPNPFIEGLNIDLFMKQSEAYQINLLDKTGRNVFQAKGKAEIEGLNQLKLDLPSSIPASSYILEIILENRSIIRQVVKVK